MLSLSYLEMLQQDVNSGEYREFGQKLTVYLNSWKFSQIA